MEIFLRTAFTDTADIAAITIILAIKDTGAEVIKGTVRQDFLASVLSPISSNWKTWSIGFKLLFSGIRKDIGKAQIRGA